MHHRYDEKSAQSGRDVEVHPVRLHERQPNFILIAVMAFAIFLIITSYFGK